VASPQADPGSFRDPSSRVFLDGDSVWRGLTEDALADYHVLARSQFFARALERRDVVATELVEDPPPLPGLWAGVLRHERVPVVSYPYEWSFEMLRDAALLQLRLAREGLAERILPKDASSYNVQFVGSRPVFIDIGSFERLRSSEPWRGYRQFCELFLNPLLVQARRDVPFQPLLRGCLDGIPPTQAAALLGASGFRRGTVVHVRLHARADRRFADADRTHDVPAELKRAGFGAGMIDAQLRNLERTVSRLRWRRSQSTWSDYGDRAHYSDRDLETKEEVVRAAVDPAQPPRLVLDLGANDGRFTRVALDAGAKAAIAADVDDLVVDQLYRAAREQRDERILPLVLDLTNPSPALGWRLRERLSFTERVRPDLVLCLAVVHHLALTGTVPLDEVVAMLADFAAPVVVEFPHRDDPMAARLLARKRTGLFDAYDLPPWEAALDRRFGVVRRTELPSGTRTLYYCRPR
jgi:hypothetical protein